MMKNPPSRRDKGSNRLKLQLIFQMNLSLRASSIAFATTIPVQRREGGYQILSTQLGSEFSTYLQFAGIGSGSPWGRT
jgi:hypothetical protein